MRITSSRIRTVSALFLLLILLLSGLTGCIFTQKSKEFTLTQDEKNITEISRVFVTWDQNNQMSIEIEETVTGEQLAPALQALRELPCKQPRYEPYDFRGKECFQIKFADGSYQLLDLYCNVVYDKDGLSPLYEYLEFEETQFLTLWNQDLGGVGGKP